MIDRRSDRDFRQMFNVSAPCPRIGNFVCASKLIARSALSKCSTFVSFTLLFLFMLACNSSTTAEEKEVLLWLKNNSITLNDSSPTESKEQILPIVEWLGDSKIIGLGEATHGSREIFQMKDKLIRLLIEDGNVRLIAIEAGWSETTALNDYISGGQKTLSSAISGLYMWIHDTEEFRGMLSWLRDYNERQPIDEKVQIIGIDAQYTDTAANKLSSYLEAVAPKLSKVFQNEMAILFATHSRDLLVELKESERAGILSTFAELDRNLSDRRTEWIRLTSEERFNECLKHLRNLKQVVSLAFQFGEPYAESEARESLLKENTVDAARAMKAPESRMVIWAHNDHISTEKRKPAPLGRRLRDEYGERYVAFGFAFGKGSFNAIKISPFSDERPLREFHVREPNRNSVEKMFSSIGAPISITNLRQAKNSSAWGWLKAPHPMRQAGSAIWRVKKDTLASKSLASSFDVLVHITQTTSARTKVN